MKTRHRAAAGVLGAAMLLVLSACATSGSKLDGFWECVTPASKTPDTRTVKILADGHFACGGQSADGAIAYTGGGTCRLDGEQYIETVAWHWAPALVGQTIVFDCTLKDGLWYHRAVFEAQGERFDINEVWRRVREPKPVDD
jgi:hypothetical protein